MDAKADEVNDDRPTRSHIWGVDFYFVNRLKSTSLIWHQLFGWSMRIWWGHLMSISFAVVVPKLDRYLKNGGANRWAYFVCLLADESLLESLSVSVDFDDGDHREVPLNRIRMLPDHFANLTELDDAARIIVKDASPVGVRVNSLSSFSIAEKKRRLSLPRLSEHPLKLHRRSIVKRSRVLLDAVYDDSSSNSLPRIKYSKEQWIATH